MARSAIPIRGPSILFLLDIPLLNDADANANGVGGYYRGVSTGLWSWPGAAVFTSPDDTDVDYTPVSETRSIVRMTFGYATAALGAPRSPWTWDRENTLNVKMNWGSFSSASALAVLNGANTLAVQIGGGNYFEIIRFQNAALESDGTYTLSGLLRGRRGTEWACDSHATHDLCLLLNGQFHESYPSGLVGKERFFRAVTVGTSIDSAPTTSFTSNGNELRPYAPVNITGSRDGSNNLTINWTRRTRIGGAWLDGSGTVPLSEESELYNVTIMSGLSVVRKIVATSPTATYSAADQTTDFGSPQSAITVRVYQVSAAVGQGFGGPAVTL